MLSKSMPKFTIYLDGSIGTDSPQAALELQRAILGRKTRVSRPAGSATSSSDTLNLKAKLFLAALLKTGKGLTTEQAARAIEVAPKSLPPVVRSLNSWCKHQKIVLDQMVKRTTAYDNRRVISLYNLTDEGRVFFAGRVELATAPPNGAGSKAAEA